MQLIPFKQLPDHHLVGNRDQWPFLTFFEGRPIAMNNSFSEVAHRENRWTSRITGIVLGRPAQDPSMSDTKGIVVTSGSVCGRLQSHLSVPGEQDVLQFRQG